MPEKWWGLREIVKSTVGCCQDIHLQQVGATVLVSVGLPYSGFSACSSWALGHMDSGLVAPGAWLPKASGHPSEWTGWISVQSKGLSRVFSNTTVQKHSFSKVAISCIIPIYGEGNGTPLQYSCLENPMDGQMGKDAFFFQHHPMVLPEFILSVRS